MRNKSIFQASEARSITARHRFGARRFDHRPQPPRSRVDGVLPITASWPLPGPSRSTPEGGLSSMLGGAKCGQPPPRFKSELRNGRKFLPLRHVAKYRGALGLNGRSLFGLLDLLARDALSRSVPPPLAAACELIHTLLAAIG